MSDYPRWVYHEDGRATIVLSEEGAGTLGEGWGFDPHPVHRGAPARGTAMPGIAEEFPKTSAKVEEYPGEGRRDNSTVGGNIPHEMPTPDELRKPTSRGADVTPEGGLPFDVSEIADPTPTPVTTAKASRRGDKL